MCSFKRSMFRHVFALLAVLAIAPAHASLIEYSFESRVIDHLLSGGGYLLGDTVTGGFMFDDAAPQLSHSEWSLGNYLSSSSTYDESALSFWITVGDNTYTGRGDLLAITENGVPTNIDIWRLTVVGDGVGDTIASGQINLHSAGYTPLTNSDLQVTNPADWGCVPPLGCNREIGMSFTDGTGFHGYMTSITPTSVPEPATLSLFAAGIVGVFMRRRRNASILGRP